MSGPATRPTTLKLLSGTVRKDRAPGESVALPAVSAVPAPPDWLPNAHAVKEWHRLAPIMVANRLVTEADLSSLGHLCAVHGKLVQLWSAGEAPTGHMLAQYNALAGAFGLAPAWRSKVKPVADEGKQNPFAKHKAG